MDEQPVEQKSEACPEPETVQGARKIVDKLNRMIDAGEVESLSVYVEARGGGYMNFQSAAVSRHEDAGRMLELMLLRLGFRQPDPDEDD